jgi:hypothetical protein
MFVHSSPMLFNGEEQVASCPSYSEVFFITCVQCKLCQEQVDVNDVNKKIFKASCLAFHN